VPWPGRRSGAAEVFEEVPSIGRQVTLPRPDKRPFVQRMATRRPSPLGLAGWKSNVFSLTHLGPCLLSVRPIRTIHFYAPIEFSRTLPRFSTRHSLEQDTFQSLFLVFTVLQGMIPKKLWLSVGFLLFLFRPPSFCQCFRYGSRCNPLFSKELQISPFSTHPLSEISAVSASAAGTAKYPRVISCSTVCGPSSPWPVAR